MSQSVLIINGAVRINGNTDILVREIIEGAKKTGLNPKLVELKKKNISDCIGCYTCLKDSKCSYEDDMTEIRNFITESELIILASPLYWCGVTGLMKTFLDRLFFYYHPQNRNLIAGKNAVIITPMNQKDINYESEILVEFYNRLLNCLGVKNTDMFFFNDIMERGSVLNNPKHLEQAYCIGKNLKFEK